MLENPHCVHNHGHCIYHTKVLRLFHAKQPPHSSSSCSSPVKSSPALHNNNKCAAGGGGEHAQHVMHKTFHIPAVVLPSAVRLNGDQRALLPLYDIEETMAKVRRWISMTGA